MSNTRVYFFRKMRVVDLDWVRTNSTLKKLLWLRRNLLNSWKSERRRVKPRRLKMCFSRLRGLCKNKLRYMSKTAFLEFWRSNNYHNLALFSILWPFYDFKALTLIQKCSQFWIVFSVFHVVLPFDLLLFVATYWRRNPFWRFRLDCNLHQ